MDHSSSRSARHADTHLGDHQDGEVEEHDLGLRHDLGVLRARRGVLGLLGGGAVAGTAVLAGGLLRGGDAAAAARAGRSGAGACSADEIPTETGGPYPGDGSNGPDVLDDAGVVRRDIRSSFGDSTGGGTAEGVPFTFALTLTDTADCDPVEGLALYAWHCDREGRYSMYSSGVTDENYLRGVQISNRRGVVKFRSIFPACYSGRWPHVHFEVYRDRDAATSGGTPLVTSQLALPRKTCLHVYRHAEGYEASVTNLERISLGSDMVFGDDHAAHQLAAVTGNLTDGYRATLAVPVDV